MARFSCCRLDYAGQARPSPIAVRDNCITLLWDGANHQLTEALDGPSSPICHLDLTRLVGPEMRGWPISADRIPHAKVAAELLFSAVCRSMMFSLNIRPILPDQPDPPPLLSRPLHPTFDLFSFFISSTLYNCWNRARRTNRGDFFGYTTLHPSLSPLRFPRSSCRPGSQFHATS